MPKVILNKSTKIKGKGFVLAGVEVDVTGEQEKQLKEAGFIGAVKKDTPPNSDKEIQALVKKVAALEDQIKEGGDTSALQDENKTLKTENEEIKKELVKLAGGKEEHKSLLGKFGLGK